MKKNNPKLALKNSTGCNTYASTYWSGNFQKYLHKWKVGITTNIEGNTLNWDDDLFDYLGSFSGKK